MPPDDGKAVDAATQWLQDKVASRKDKELAHWQAWKNSGEDPKKLQPLLKMYDNLVNQKTRQWKAGVTTIPDSAFKAELQSHIIKAFKNYDPSRGTALNTHVESRLPKAKRYRNRYQNTLYIPEEMAGKIGKLNSHREKLTEELGREPTIDELSDHIGLSPKRVKSILDAQQKTVPMGRSGGEDSYDYGSGDGSTAHAFEDQQIAIAQNILPTLFPNKPEMHQLFGHVFGVNDHRQISSTSELARVMGKTEPQISRMKTQMGMVLRTHMAMNDEDDEDDEG